MRRHAIGRGLAAAPGAFDAEHSSREQKPETEASQNSAEERRPRARDQELKMPHQVVHREAIDGTMALWYGFVAGRRRLGVTQCA
jgi:hypothetical protein